MKIIVIVPRREEFLACEVLKGLHRKGVELITTAPLTNIRNAYEVGEQDFPETKYYSDDEIIEHAKSADYIFVLWSKFASPYETSPQGKTYLLDKINAPEKTVVIDGSEYSWTGHPANGKFDKALYKSRRDIFNCSKGIPWIWEEMRNKANWYFKRETYTDDITENNIIPCPYPFRIEDRQQPKDRDIALLCAFGQTDTGLRAAIQDACRTIKHKLPVLADKQDGGRLRYLDLLSRSYMAVDAWGGGDCTVRTNEAHINSIALCKQAWGIVEPYPFRDGKNIILYNTTEEFIEKTNYYLKNLDELIKIGENGYQHTLKYHTTEKRIDYIFDVINEKIKWS